MAIRAKTYNQAKSLLKAIEIGNEVILKSIRLDEKTKVAFIGLNDYSKNYIETAINNEKLTATNVKSIEKELLIYWNESISQEVEQFWYLINKNNLPYKRNSPIRELLEKNRFRQVDQWIDLFNNLDALRSGNFLDQQFTKEEIKKLDELIRIEEKKRFELVNKCLRKKKIPFSQYLKFGESMAFLERCNLTKEYFSDKEKEEIYEIWRTN